MSRPVRMEVRDPEAMPAGWPRDGWCHHGVGTAPARLAALGADSRWRVRYATAWDRVRLVGVLPMCRPGVAEIWDRDYDLRKLVNTPVPADARRWLFVGGCRDLASGALVAAGLAAPPADAVRAELVATAVDTGRAEGLTVVAAYLRDAELPAFVAGAPHPTPAVRTGDNAVLRLPRRSAPDPSLVGYLALFDRKRRNKIRRDWRDFTAAGLRSTTLPMGEAIEAGAELVTAVKRRHGIPDHPRIAAMRLRQWHALELGTYAAFGVHDANRRLLAVCFVCTVGTALDVHEIGLADDPGVRLVSYLEAGFYAPIRFALAEGCTTVELGGAAAPTKLARGARMEPVWTVVLSG